MKRNSDLDGTELLVIHGDQFDVITPLCHRMAGFLGGQCLRVQSGRSTVELNQLACALWFTAMVAVLLLKHKVKKAVNIHQLIFEDAVATKCVKSRDDQGVVCGPHTFNAEIRQVNGITYHNCGDWVESLYRAGRAVGNGG